MKRLFVLIIVLMLASCGGAKDGAAPAKEPEAKQHTFDSLQAAMDSGMGMRCTFAYEDGTGVALVKGGKYSTTVKAEGQVAHSITDGTNMYVWVEGQDGGIMITAAEIKEAGVKAESQYGIFDQDKKIAFACLPHVVSGSSFQPPSDIKFITLTEMMEELMEGLFS